MGRVFDHSKSIFLRNSEDRIHIARMPVKVNGHDGLDPDVVSLSLQFLEGFSKLRGINVERVRFNVHEDRSRPDMLNHVDAGAKGHRRGQDRIARADT
jgi:hypothetical protein